ncbi:MAG TPA: FtsX-like permease family protein [Polyangiaceae bacterium]|nr:FtsX-like permease family protein [Polyangiaceae bacterium]
MIPLSYNIRSLFVRKTTTIATALGIGLVVFVLAAALMLSAGIKKTLVSAGRPDNAIVLRKGADTELASTIETRFVSLILAAPGVKRTEQGAPLGHGELVAVITADKLGTEGQVSNIQVRGVPDAVLKLRTEARLVAGRPPTPGTDEVLVGSGISGRFKGTELGQSFELKKNRPVTVVGIFESGGSSFESEIWADIDTVRTSFGREGLVSSVTVRLDSALKFDAFRATMESDKQLGLETLREDEYYRKQSEGTSLFIGIIGAMIAAFFSVGASIGATITMHAAVAQRQREIGTLRALGFSRLSILGSFLLESLVLSLVGGVFGLLAAVLLSFTKVSMMNFATWQEVTFGFDPNPAVLMTALVAGALMGILGGFSPALRASRVSAVEAMRG